MTLKETYTSKYFKLLVYKTKLRLSGCQLTTSNETWIQGKLNQIQMELMGVFRANDFIYSNRLDASQTAYLTKTDLPDQNFARGI